MNYVLFYPDGTLRYLIDPSRPNFFRYLREAGFATCLSAKNHCLDEYPKLRQQQQYPESVCRVVMRRDRPSKLSVRTNGENELYDLDADPLEYRNLYLLPESPERVAEPTQRLTTWLIHTSDVVPWERHERMRAHPGSESRP